VENQHTGFDPPTAANVTVMAKRPREYLKEPEIERLMDAARQNRCGHRDATAILMAYRHGLRASELVGLRWDDLDLAHGRLHVRRSKGGEAAVHPIGGKEMRALRRQGYLGHRSIMSTQRYTALAPDRFKRFWKD